MLNIYDYKDFREFLKTLLSEKTGDKATKFTASSIARAIGISTSLMSLILSGEKNINADQALAICENLKLSDHATDYFLLLAEYERAGTHNLKLRLEKKIKQAEERARRIETRVKKDFELSEESKAIYYSSWTYTAIRNLSAIEGMDSDRMATHLQISKDLVDKIIDFLLEENLCIKKNEKIINGPAHSHLGATSPFITKHHQNWRIRGFQKMDLRSSDDLFYSCPMSLSKEVALLIRKKLPLFIEEILKISGPSASEEVRCLNIDWFNY